jgi:REP element-mobilizing transposase RayT
MRASTSSASVGCIPRTPRRVLPPSGIYHVTNRGVARCAIFRDDVDRQLFVARLRRLAPELSWKCFVYCLMTTHFHLLVAASLEQLSTGMRRLEGPYAQQFNAKHARVGHLFQERFHARVVRDELHFARVYEYILNNPVAAGMCPTPHDWPWTGSI